MLVSAADLQQFYASPLGRKLARDCAKGLAGLKPPPTVPLMKLPITVPTSSVARNALVLIAQLALAALPLGYVLGYF